MARYEAESLDMIETAAQGGVPDALFHLGVMYCSGREVPLDMIEAHKWFNLAAMRGNDAAKRYRQEIAAELTKMELGMAQRRAREWLSQH
jgi:uncharacterized protein